MIRHQNGDFRVLLLDQVERIYMAYTVRDDYSWRNSINLQVFAPQGINEGVAQALVRYAAWQLMC